MLVSVLIPLIGPLFLREAGTRGPGDALPALRYLTVLDSYYILIFRWMSLEVPGYLLAQRGSKAI